MAEQFYTILTAIGKAKIANSVALGEKVELTHLALGDGGGSYYNPTEDQTELRNEVWRGAIGTVDVDTENPNWVIIQTVIPSQHGGFMIREAGVFDDDGDLIAVGKYPETYKPVVADGSIKDLVVRMILEVSNAASVVLKVDPTVVLATQQQVNEAEARAKAYTDQEVGEVAQVIDAHKAAAAPHSGHETPAGAQAKAEAAAGVVRAELDAHKNEVATQTEYGHIRLSDIPTPEGIPRGIIVMWSGSVEEIPSGWALCDGQNGTPDLRDRFIVGAGGEYSIGDTGGEKVVALSVNELPTHNHDLNSLRTDSAGSHSHSGSTSTAGSHTHSYIDQLPSTSSPTPRFGDGNFAGNSPTTRTTDSGGSHSHSISISSAGSHTHYISGSTENSGNNEPHENRPPYYALCFIMKL